MQSASCLILLKIVVCTQVLWRTLSQLLQWLPGQLASLGVSLSQAVLEKEIFFLPPLILCCSQGYRIWLIVLRSGTWYMLYLEPTNLFVAGDHIFLYFILAAEGHMECRSNARMKWEGSKLEVFHFEVLLCFLHKLMHSIYKKLTAPNLLDLSPNLVKLTPLFPNRLQLSSIFDIDLLWGSWSTEQCAIYGLQKVFDCTWTVG